MKPIKMLMVVVPLGAVASFAVPAFLDQQHRSDLTKKFNSALTRYDKVNITPGAKKGQLAWPNTVASMDKSTLPAIPGGVLIMKQGERIVSGSNWEDRPPKFHDSFFQLDEALLPKSASDVRTLVYVKPHFLDTQYSAGGRRGAVTRSLNQKVVRVHIYDLEQNVGLGSWVLLGQKPPRSFKASRMPDMAPPPSVAEFLAAFPQR